MGTEKPEQATQTGQEPEQEALSGMGDYIAKFQRDQEADRATAEKKKAEASPEKSPKESEGKIESPNEEVQETGSTEKPTEKKTEQKTQYLIDDTNPFVIKVDGEEIPVSDIEKLKTYAQLGYHGNKRLEELKKQEEELKKKEELFVSSESQLMQIKKALDEGRLIIKPDKGSEEHPNRAEGDEDSEDIYEDPEYQKLAKKNKQLEKEVSTIKELMLGTVFEKAKGDLDAQIAKAKKDYPKADDEEIWRLLAKVDEKTKKPVFANVEDAVKHSHERIQSLLNKYIEENTDLKKITPEIEDKIITDYLSKQQELEKAPVSPPSTSSTSSEPTKGSKREFKSFNEAITAASEDLKGSLRLGRKS